MDKPAPTNADEDGSGDVSVGDTLTYTITATNDGTSNLTNVVVSDSLITPTGGTTPCALVAPGGTCTLIGTYVVTRSRRGRRAQIVNTGTADSDQTDPVDDPETVPVPTPSLSVDKPAPTNADEDGSGDVSVGDTLTYTITATNDGDVEPDERGGERQPDHADGRHDAVCAGGPGWHLHADRHLRGDGGRRGGGPDR